MGVRLTHHAGDGRDVHQRAPALLPHDRKGGAATVHVPHDVDVHDLAEVLQGSLLEGAEYGHGRGVDPHVDAAEVLHRAPGQVLDRLGVRDVGRHDEGLSATVVFTLLADRLQRLLPPCGQYHAAAPAGERDGRGPPDAAGRAGDHDDGIAHSHGRLLLLALPDLALPVLALPVR
jgi:hypothetical protein